VRRIDWTTILKETRGRAVANWLSGGPDGRGARTVDFVDSVSTDTRDLMPGDLFFALSGEKFDAHAFVLEALELGSSACVIAESEADRVLESIATSDDPALFRPPRLIAVDAPLFALERLAVWNRRGSDAEATAITGSVGKTTTKEFLSALLAQKYRVTAAPKSFNNRVGVALTLLAVDEKTEQIVLEMGTSGTGEISYLSRMAEPDRVIVTTIAPAHLSGLGSLDGIIDAKMEILDGLREGGSAYFNSRMKGFDRFVERAGDTTNVQTFDPEAFGAESERGKCPIGHQFVVAGQRFELPVPGRHNVGNAGVAVQVAMDIGVDVGAIRAGLLSSRLPPGRLDVRESGGVVFVDDSYNANPRSMESAIETLEDIAARRPGGRRIAVLGDMLELGRDSRLLHEAVGRRLAENPVDVLVTVGDASRHLSGTFSRELERRKVTLGSRVAHFDAVDSARDYLEADLRDGDKLLFKASNAIGIGTLAEELRTLVTSRATSEREPVYESE